MAHGIFVTAVNCMDGRTQQPVVDWMRARFGADYVDTITEPGPDGILADGPLELIESIRRRVEISVKIHGSRAVAVVSHDDCAGNPVTRERRMEQLAAAVHRVKDWGFPAVVLGVYVDEHGRLELMHER